MDIQKFKNKNRPKGRKAKKSMLHSSKNSIKELLDENYSHSQIKDFIALDKNLNLSRRAISYFIKKHISNNETDNKKERQDANIIQKEVTINQNTGGKMERLDKFFENYSKND